MIVINSGGHTIKGSIDSASDARIILNYKVDSGEVLYTLYRNDISDIILPGREIATFAFELVRENKRVEALPFLHALYTQRFAFLGLLPEKNVVIFTHLVSAYLQTEEYRKCVSVAQRIAPLIEDPKTKDKIEDAILLCTYNLGNYDDALNLANSWIEKARRFHPSALGSWILAMVKFERGFHESALWVSFKPIVFSSQMPIDFLAECYAVAIATCVELKYDDEAKVLYAEMLERGFYWPDIALLEPYAPQLRVMEL